MQNKHCIGKVIVCTIRNAGSNESSLDVSYISKRQDKTTELVNRVASITKYARVFTSSSYQENSQGERKFCFFLPDFT